MVNRFNKSQTSGDGVGAGATPSLCSDNDNDTEDRIPMTPPLPPASQSSSVQSQPRTDIASTACANEPNELVNGRTTKETTHEVNVPPAQLNSHLPLTNGNDPFSHRRPSSPLPPETPRRPRPPARTHNLRMALKEKKSNRVLPDDSLSLNTISFHPAGESTPAVETVGNKLSRQRLTLEDEIRNASSDYGSEELALIENSSTTLNYDDEEQQLLAALEHGTFVGVGQRPANEGFLSHGGGGGTPVFNPLVTSQVLTEPAKGKKRGRPAGSRGRRKKKT